MIKLLEIVNTLMIICMAKYRNFVNVQFKLFFKNNFTNFQIIQKKFLN